MVVFCLKFSVKLNSSTRERHGFGCACRIKNMALSSEVRHKVCLHVVIHFECLISQVH